MSAYRAPEEFYSEIDKLTWQMLRPLHPPIKLQGPEKRFELPEPPIKALPVDALVSAVNGLMTRVADSPIGRTINNASERLPYLRERPFVTPFGRVKLPEVKLPEIHEVELDEHKRTALGNAVGIDAAQVFGLVPVIGDLVADAIEDIHNEALRDALNDQEFKTYSKYDKLGPSTVAVARTFMRNGSKLL